MIYPLNFVEQVKTAYPHSKALHEALDQNSVLVGRYLEDGKDFKMPPEEIIQSFNDKREEKVLREATLAVQRTKLYAEWSEIYQSQK